MTKDTALQACQRAAKTALKNEHPASKVKVHWILGVLAAEIKDDVWFIEVEASIDSNRVHVESHVAGAEERPRIQDMLYY